MLTGAELMEWIGQFGRWNVQQFVAKSQDMTDVLTYLRVERDLEMIKVTSFVTADTVNFQKTTGFPPIAEESEICTGDGLILSIV